MGYLAVIGFLGWVLLEIIRYTFMSIRDGTLAIPDSAGMGFSNLQARSHRDSAVSPDGQLSVSAGLRVAILSGFFGLRRRAFDFGSSGAINNIMSGITLTYTGAFRPGISFASAIPSALSVRGAFW